MAVYNITNVQLNVLDTQIANVKSRLEERRALWQAAHPDVQSGWRLSCPDPIIDRLYKLYLWLKEFFGE